MNKTELLAEIAERVDMTQKDIAKIMGALVATISEAVARGEAVRIPGFGTFKTQRRKARMGRNPRTGEKIEIPSRLVPVFVAAKGLRKASLP